MSSQSSEQAGQSEIPLHLDATPSPPNEELDQLIIDPNQPTAGELSGSEAECALCEKSQPDLVFCNVCDCNFCPSCWDLQIVHKPRYIRPGRIPHEKISLGLNVKIHNLLQKDISILEEERLHIKDQATIWFGVFSEQGKLPRLRDYDPLANLLSPVNSENDEEQREEKFPGLVSFVGEAGSGKSTIIRLLSGLATEEGDAFAKPVVGSDRHRGIPISSDVHLYADPKSITTTNPIFYVECEGLSGGERESLSRRILRQCQESGKTENAPRHLSDREIARATTPEKASREFAVTDLFSPLLYMYSDTVVFVLKNPRTIENTIEKLVTWGSSPINHSSIPSSLPHVIIVLNAAEPTLDSDSWDTDIATRKILQYLAGSMLLNQKLKSVANSWRERGRSCDTLAELLLCYYSSLKVVRIPSEGRPNLMADQVMELYNCIEKNGTQALLEKTRLRMLLNGDEFQMYMQMALEFCATELFLPFDFVEASFRRRPMRLDLGYKVLRLAIEMRDVWENVASGAIIFKEISYMVASCIMLHSARQDIRGTAIEIAVQYEKQLNECLKDFSDSHWPCEFVKPGRKGGRCTNVRADHKLKGHQLRSGRNIGAGDYKSEFSFERHGELFQDNIFVRLQELLHLLKEQLEQDKGISKNNAAFDLHYSAVMKNFYSHVMRGGHDTYIIPNVCFCCIFEDAVHVLSCGHVLCASCYESFNSRNVRGSAGAARCPIEGLFEWGAVYATEARMRRASSINTGGGWSMRPSMDSARPLTSSTNANFIASYSEDTYILGNTSMVELEASMGRLSGTDP